MKSVCSFIVLGKQGTHLYCDKHLYSNQHELKYRAIVFGKVRTFRFSLPFEYINTKALPNY